MASPLVFFSILAVIIATAYLYAKNAFLYWQRKGVAFAKPNFPFGNFGKVFLQQVSFNDLIKELYFSSDAPVLGTFSSIAPSVIIRDPAVIQDILIKEFSSFNTRGINANVDIDPLANNLFLQNGEQWKRMRSALSPTFTSGKLKGMFEAIINCGQPLDNHIEKLVKSGETFEIREVFAKYSTNVIASVAFGIEIDCFADPESAFRKYGEKVFKPTFSNTLRRTITFLAPRLSKFLRLRFADKDICWFMTDMVQRNLTMREENNITRKDFFQLLMQLRNTGSVNDDDSADWSTKASSNEKQLSIDEMTAHAFIFFVGNLCHGIALAR